MILRGAGLTGLKGMSARTLLPIFDAQIPVVRPLLDTWRKETLGYCADHDLHPLSDPSNDSLDFTRNRLRNVLIPTLEGYNPEFRGAVWRSVQSLEADHALLREIVNAAWETSVISRKTGRITFDLPKLAAFPPALQRNLIRQAIETLQPGQETGFALLHRATSFINESSGGQVELTGGLRLFREGLNLHIAAAESDLPSEGWPQMPPESVLIRLTVPGVVELPGGWKLTCEDRSLSSLALAQVEQNLDPFQAWLEAGELGGELALRSRVEGDRFEPLGMEGRSQKLSDFMINEKMPRRFRDRWPLLCSGDKVIWVPGYRPAHATRVRPGSRKILYLVLSRNFGESPLE
jgi:tRNA(Ile)-lysidine synthase